MYQLYVTKPIMVEAVQLIEGKEKTFARAFKELLRPLPGTNGKLLQVMEGEGSQVMSAGDWLVKLVENKYQIMKDAEFKKLYVSYEESEDTVATFVQNMKQVESSKLAGGAEWMHSVGHGDLDKEDTKA